MRTDFIVWSLLPEDLEGGDEQLADSRRLQRLRRLELTPAGAAAAPRRHAPGTLTKPASRGPRT